MHPSNGKSSLHGTPFDQTRYWTDPGKVSTVVEASQPQSPSELLSFLGLVGFSARFIPDFSTTAEPLRKIARKGEPFLWGEEQEKSLQKLEEQIASAPVLAYFGKKAHTQIIADASPVALGAVLVQDESGERRAVLALVWACEGFACICMVCNNLNLLLIMRHSRLFTRQGPSRQLG